MLYKVHKAYRPIIAVCDFELFGKKFEEDEKVLDLTSDFYDGSKITSEEMILSFQEGMKEDSIFNLVGEKICNLALDEGFIESDGIKKIAGIPFAMILL